MKQIATMALMINLGVAGIYAQQNPMNMTVSGTSAASVINLQPGGLTSEYQLTGDGSLGPITLRVVNTNTPAPQRSSTCSGPTKVYFVATAGAGVLRAQEGSLLKLSLTGGGDCIDFAAGQALCIRVFQVLGGTGRFQNAAGGTVTLTMNVVPVLGDASNNPVFFAVTGGVTGAVPGVAASDR